MSSESPRRAPESYTSAPLGARYQVFQTIKILLIAFVQIEVASIRRSRPWSDLWRIVADPLQAESRLADLVIRYDAAADRHLPPNGVGRCIECLSPSDCSSGGTCSTNGRCQNSTCADEASLRQHLVELGVEGVAWASDQFSSGNEEVALPRFASSE